MCGARAEERGGREGAKKISEEERKAEVKAPVFKLLKIKNAGGKGRLDGGLAGPQNQEQCKAGNYKVGHM